MSADVRQILTRYDSLTNWTMTEVRYVQDSLGCSESKALKLVRAARREMSTNQDLWERAYDEGQDSLGMRIAMNLSKTLGGTWTYSPGAGSWTCDDNKRWIQRTHSGTRDHQGELTDGPSHYWLYGEGAPRRAEQYMSADCEIKGAPDYSACDMGRGP